MGRKKKKKKTPKKRVSIKKDNDPKLSLPERETVLQGNAFSSNYSTQANAQKNKNNIELLDFDSPSSDSTKLNSENLKKTKSKKRADNDNITPSDHRIKKYIFLLVFVFLCALFTFAFFHFRSSRISVVNGRLNQLGDIEMSYSRAQSNSISALCGCLNEEIKAEDLRGITFSARDVTIQVREKDFEASSEPVNYFVTGAYPDPIQWTPSLFKFKAEIYVILMPKYEIFEPKTLLEAVERGLHLLIVGDLNISMLGNKPIGAWLPCENNKVYIEQEDGLYSTSKSIATITEVLQEIGPELALQKYKEHGESGFEFPICDFLGPNVVLWTENFSAKNSTSILGLGWKKALSSLDREIPDDKKCIIGILITKPPFSVRVACQPALLSTQTKAIASVLLGETIPDFCEYACNAAEIKLIIEDPWEQSTEFGDVYNDMLQEETVLIKQIPFNSSVLPEINIENIKILSDFEDAKQEELIKQIARYLGTSESNLRQEMSKDEHTKRILKDQKVNLHSPETTEMIFRYPPVPPERGFNIFGSFDNLSFMSATGDILIKSRHIKIPVSSSLIFKNIQAVNIQERVISIPIQAHESYTNLNFQVTSEIYLNGDIMNTVADDLGFHENWEYLFLVFAFFQALGAVISIRRAFR